MPTTEEFMKAAGFRRAEHWEQGCDSCGGLEEGAHYCLVLGVQIKNADIMRCDYFESN